MNYWIKKIKNEQHIFISHAQGIKVILDESGVVVPNMCNENLRDIQDVHVNTQHNFIYYITNMGLTL